MFKVAPALVLGAGMLSFASPRVGAQEQDPRWERDQLKWHRQEERSAYGNGPVKGHWRQEQEQFRYQERVERSGYYGGGPYGQYSPYQSGPYGAYSQNGRYGTYEQYGTSGGSENSQPSHDHRLWFGNDGIFSRRYGHRQK
jgi:hypothetical protein